MTTSDNDELVFLPLGGSNEIGMNFNLYGFGPPHARKWIVVDLGVTFGDQTTPGVDIILPDPTFIEEHAGDILGIVLTHAHEDHIGAVAWLWPRFKAPIYATPFTAFILREVEEHKPRAVVLCFGPDAAHYRVQLLPEYHADREELPDQGGDVDVVGERSAF